jgi:uncharacterized protein (DUF58 family)
MAVVWTSVAIVLGVVGWFKTINLLVLVGYLLLALIGVNAWLAWRSAAHLTARRNPTRPAFPGETVVLTADVFNPTAKPVTAVLTDQSSGNRSAWLLAPLGPGESRTVTARWTYSLRGRHRVGPLAVDGSYPFGLVHAVRPIAPEGEVLVLPPTGRVNLESFRRWLIRGGAGDGTTRRLARRASPGHGDVRGIRPFRTGDSPRHIHWRSSARRGQILVREYDRTTPLDLLLVIDPWFPAGRRTPESSARLEWVLSLAATLVETWCEADEPAELTLAVVGPDPQLRTGRGTPSVVRHLLTPLATVAGYTSNPVVPHELVRGRSNRTARVLLSTRPACPVGSDFHRAGLPLAVVDPTTPPAWFTPPAGCRLAPPTPSDPVGSAVPYVSH